MEESTLSFAEQIEHQKTLSQSAKLNRSSGSIKLKQSLDSSVVSSRLASSQKLLNVKGYVGQLCGQMAIRKNLKLHLDNSESEIESDSESDSDNENTSNMFDPDADFESIFGPCDMRCLALIAQDHMEDALKDFVLTHKNLLRKFRLTGSWKTMAILKKVYEDDLSLVYGPTCGDGIVGGYAEIATLMTANQLGGMVFFQDPLAHNAEADGDVEFLNRQAWKQNIMCMNNPASAHAGVYTLRAALKEGRCDLIPSFFFNLESPSVVVEKSRLRGVQQKYS